MSKKPGPWSIEVYEDENGHRPYETFIDSLDDATFAALDAAVDHMLRRNGIDLCKTEWMKPLGQGLYEFRVRHDAAEILARFGLEPEVAVPLNIPILLRVFCHFHANKIVLLLSGYDKGASPSEKRQQKEIERARGHLRAWQEVQKRAAARARRGR